MTKEEEDEIIVKFCDRMSYEGSFGEGEYSLIRYISGLLVLEPGEMLHEAGTLCENLFFIEKGLTRTFYHYNGKEITEDFASEGDMIIRAESVFGDKPSQRSIQVLEPSHIITFRAHRWMGFFNQNPCFEILFCHLIQKEWTETLHRNDLLQFHSAEERYLDFVQHSPELVRRIPPRYLASYLRISQLGLKRFHRKFIPK